MFTLEKILKEHGVGFALSKTTAQSFIGYYNPVSNRIISSHLQSHPFYTTIVQVYAPTSSSSEEALENFYGHQEVLDKTPKTYFFLVMRDFNV